MIVTTKPLQRFNSWKSCKSSSGLEPYSYISHSYMSLVFRIVVMTALHVIAPFLLCTECGGGRIIMFLFLMVEIQDNSPHNRHLVSALTRRALLGNRKAQFKQFLTVSSISLSRARLATRTSPELIAMVEASQSNSYSSYLSVSRPMRLSCLCRCLERRDL